MLSVQSFCGNMDHIYLFLRISPSVMQKKGPFCASSTCVIQTSISGDSKKIIHKILKAYESELSSSAMKFEVGHVLASISKAKSKGHSPDDIRRASRPDDKVQMMIARFYQDYVAALKESNSLDFDDLLLHGVKLFTKERKTVVWCRHLLVDEL